MYRKLAALVLAAALLCSCSARVTVQRYPAELPRAESPAATPTPEPVPTFTEEQKAYGSAALLTERDFIEKEGELYVFSDPVFERWFKREYC